MKTTTAVIAVAAVMLLTPAAPVAGNAPEGEMAMSISVGYVVVPFVVTDRRGKPVRDLQEKDVRLLVDGGAVRHDMFTRADNAPVSFTILVDASGSMALAGKMESAKEALRSLLRRQVKGDEYALYSFAAEGGVRELVPFTNDGNRILAAIDRIEPFGKTAFFDALAQAPAMTTEGTNGARAIILLTDGIDNASMLSREELSGMLAGIEMPIYPLGLRSPQQVVSMNREERLDIDVLDTVARLSGGRLLIAEKAAELDEAIRSINIDLRSQYLIGFSPTGRGAVKYRRISLRAGHTRSVRARAGYRGTAPPWQTSSIR